MTRFQLILTSYLSRDAAPDLGEVDSTLHAGIHPRQMEEVHGPLNLPAVCCMEHIGAVLAFLTALAVSQVFKPHELLIVEGKCSLTK